MLNWRIGFMIVWIIANSCFCFRSNGVHSKAMFLSPATILAEDLVKQSFVLINQLREKINNPRGVSSSLVGCFNDAKLRYNRKEYLSLVEYYLSKLAQRGDPVAWFTVLGDFEDFDLNCSVREEREIVRKLLDMLLQDKESVSIAVLAFQNLGLDSSRTEDRGIICAFLYRVAKIDLEETLRCFHNFGLKCERKEDRAIVKDFLREAGERDIVKTLQYLDSFGLHAQRPEECTIIREFVRKYEVSQRTRIAQNYAIYKYFLFSGEDITCDDALMSLQGMDDRQRLLLDHLLSVNDKGALETMLQSFQEFHFDYANLVDRTIVQIFLFHALFEVDKETTLKYFKNLGLRCNNKEETAIVYNSINAMLNKGEYASGILSYFGNFGLMLKREKTRKIIEKLIKGLIPENLRGCGNIAKLGLDYMDNRNKQLISDFLLRSLLSELSRMFLLQFVEWKDLGIDPQNKNHRDIIIEFAAVCGLGFIDKEVVSGLFNSVNPSCKEEINIRRKQSAYFFLKDILFPTVNPRIDFEQQYYETGENDYRARAQEALIAYLAEYLVQSCEFIPSVVQLRKMRESGEIEALPVYKKYTALLPVLTDCLKIGTKDEIPHHFECKVSPESKEEIKSKSPELYTWIHKLNSLELRSAFAQQADDLVWELMKYQSNTGIQA